MYARVISGQIFSKNEHVVADLYRDYVVPAASEQPGFKGIIQMMDPATGKTLSVSLWESEAAMRASEETDYYKKQLATLEDFDAAQPHPAHYKVNCYKVKEG